MTNTVMRPGRAVRDTCALILTLGWYWLLVFPVAQAELRRCRTQAAAIPDPVLRRYALATLAEEHTNAEGAAIFATLAPRRHRVSVARLLVQYQVMYDYLDTLTEQAVPDPLANGRQLHCALTAALGELPPADGYYLHHPQTEDDYLDWLVKACRRTFRALPAAETIAPLALRSARRSAEGQSHNHAAMLARDGTLMQWAMRETPAGSELQWWEAAAAAGSSLAIHALLASAADAQITHVAAETIEATYWPWINGLNTLLESLVDHAEDSKTGNHSFVGHYTTGDARAARLAMIAGQATQMVRALPRSRQHAVILAAMTSFYLSTPQAASPDVRPVVASVRAELDIGVRLLLAMLRLRRLLADRV